MLATLIIAALLVLIISALAPPIIFPKPPDKCLYHPLFYARLDETNNGNRIDAIRGLLLTNPPGFNVSYETNTIVTNATVFTTYTASAGLFSGQETGGTNNGPAYLRMTNSSYTLMTWFWPYDDGMGAAPPYGVFGKWDDDGDVGLNFSTEYCLQISAANQAVIHHYGNDGFDTPVDFFLASTNTVSTNAWNFIVAGYDLSKGKLFISLNGSEVIYSGPNIPSNWSTNGPLALGWLDGAVPYANACKMDETGIWGCVWSTNDVAYMYNGGLGRSMRFYPGDGSEPSCRFK